MDFPDETSTPREKAFIHGLDTAKGFVNIAKRAIVSNDHVNALKSASLAWEALSSSRNGYFEVNEEGSISREFKEAMDSIEFSCASIVSDFLINGLSDEFFKDVPPLLMAEAKAISEASQLNSVNVSPQLVYDKKGFKHL